VFFVSSVECSACLSYVFTDTIDIIRTYKEGKHAHWKNNIYTKSVKITYT
jgi:hypothetical protein